MVVVLQAREIGIGRCKIVQPGQPFLRCLVAAHATSRAEIDLALGQRNRMSALAEPAGLPGGMSPGLLPDLPLMIFFKMSQSDITLGESLEHGPVDGAVFALRLGLKILSLGAIVIQ